MNKLLDSLHKKILNHKFAEVVSEEEIWELVKAKERGDGWIPCSSGELPVVPEGKEYVDVIITIEEPLKEPSYMCTEYYNEDGFNYLYPSFITAWRYDTLKPYQPKGE